MSITRIPTQNMRREQWVESRKSSIGGSDAATVLGLNPYSSPYALWAEKTGALEPADLDNKEAVRLGIFLEPYVALRFTEETGKKVRRENFILKNSEFPWAHANVDRMVVGERAGLECKTTSALNLRRFKGGEYPANYYCQCMHYMAVTGYEKWYLAVLIGNSDFRVFEILRDEDEIAALMDAERRFWESVENNSAPEVDGRRATTDALAGIYSDDGSTVDLTPVCSNIRQYLSLKAQKKDLEDRMEEVANQIKQYMGNASYGTYEGLSVSWKAITSNRFDKAAFQRKNPDLDLTPYSKATVSRRFEVKG